MPSFVPYILPFSLGASVLALIYGSFLIWRIIALPKGDKKMTDIAEAIAEGGSAYLKRQYTIVAWIALLIFVILSWFLGFATGVGFLLGAGFSALAGFVGMNISVRANVRTAEAAKKGIKAALNVAFQGGSVTGLFVVGLGLLLVAGYWLFLTQFLQTTIEHALRALIALGFGGSLISVFARLGGGIYTKGADVGTDMVGKIEKGIPEDDPRNPGVIADQVGDNVGDCAGMAADLFETYVVTAVATMLLGHLIFGENLGVILYPLAIGGVAIIASLLGTFFVGTNKTSGIMTALYKGLGAAVVLAVILFYPITINLMGGNPYFPVMNLYYSSLLGLLTTVGMVVITEYYTAKKFGPVLGIAKSSETGHGTNIIAGLANSMKSTLLPVLLIAGVTLASFSLAGLYGVTIAAMSMLSLTGIIIAIDSFGPITDNAGGIAEMANLDESVRKITDPLDAVGNTTKAITKGYAIASAGLAALVLFASYTQELGQKGQAVAQNFGQFSLSDPKVLIGLFIGGALPYFFGALAMEAVGKAGMAVVSEVRRQFKEIKGLMEGKAKPEYGKCVDIVTKAALREMIVPALIPVLTPILVGFILGPQALGGLLIGIIITGLFVAISMTTGGAAWDNAKKYIEEGHLGGKGSFAHQAAVTGDTVGDPYKDTAGPAINPMIKVANIVALLIAGFLV
ncbi:sodium-translocating pyrophosphatase [Candidatus Microgenomates bacterium]|nr:sodium-translocating pyrophosphatase [Candidatus Microgenomates bacterium]